MRKGNQENGDLNIISIFASYLMENEICQKDADLFSCSCQIAIKRFGVPLQCSLKGPLPQVASLPRVVTVLFGRVIFSWPMFAFFTI